MCIWSAFTGEGKILFCFSMHSSLKDLEWVDQTGKRCAKLSIARIAKLPYELNWTKKCFIESYLHYTSCEHWQCHCLHFMYCLHCQYWLHSLHCLVKIVKFGYSCDIWSRLCNSEIWFQKLGRVSLVCFDMVWYGTSSTSDSITSPWIQKHKSISENV